LTWSLQAYVYGRAGQQAEAQRALEKLERMSWNPYWDFAPTFALAYIGMNNKDQAIGWLQKAYAEHSIAVTSLKVDPVYDPLRSDPRFQEILSRVGLAE
jgi:hypothetical protein